MTVFSGVSSIVRVITERRDGEDVGVFSLGVETRRILSERRHVRGLAIRSISLVVDAFEQNSA